MKDKYIRAKKIVMAAGMAVMLAAQMVGCSKGIDEAVRVMLESGEVVEVQVEGVVDSNETSVISDWKALATLTDQEELRKVIDDRLMIISFGENSKNGVLYVEPQTQEWEPNNTLENVYKNKAFLEYWNNSENQDAIKEAVINAYTDLDETTSPHTLELAALNGYFNIIKDNEETGEFEAGKILTRAEFMTALTRASEKAVENIKAEAELINKLGDTENTAYAPFVEEYSFLDVENRNLNEKTYSGAITRAEAIYMICNKYYADEMAKSLDELGTDCYADCKNVGSLVDSVTGGNDTQGKAAILSYMVKNPDKGMDEELYKAMVIAKKHNILGKATESRWDEAITKEETLDMLTRVYLEIGTEVNCTLGNNQVEAYIEELKILTKEEFMAELNITEEFYDVDRMYQDFVDEMNISVKNGTLAEEQPQIVTIFADMKGDYLKEEVAEEMDAEAGVSNVTEEEQPVGTQTELTLDDLVQIGTENGQPVYITKEDYNLIYGSASSSSGGGSIEDDYLMSEEEAAAAQAEYNKADGFDSSANGIPHEYTDIEKEILGNLH